MAAFSHFFADLSLEDVTSSIKSVVTHSTTKKAAIIAGAIGLTTLAAVSLMKTKANDIFNENSKCKSSKIRDYEKNIKSLNVGNGSIIYWNEYGDISENGYPILYFNGGLTCNLEGILSDSIAKSQNLRLIVVDRPGCGQSTFPNNCKNEIYHLPNHYSLQSYMNDIKKLLNYLNIKDNNYGVIGVSHSGVFCMSSLYYLKPKFIAQFVGCMLIDQTDLIKYKELMSSQLYDSYVHANNWYKYHLVHYILRLLVVYFKDTFIAFTKKQAKSEYENNDTISDNIFEDYEMSGIELIWYIAFSSVKYGIKGSLYASQLLNNNNWGFDLSHDISNDVKQNTKIFLNYGELDQIVKKEFINHYYNEYLIKKCKFKNIDFTIYDNAGHFLTQNAWSQSYKKIRKYLDHCNAQQ